MGIRADTREELQKESSLSATHLPTSSVSHHFFIYQTRIGYIWIHMHENLGHREYGFILLNPDVWIHRSPGIWRWQMNAPPLWAISIAMVRRWSDTCGIAQCSMSRATPEATGRRHRATTRSVSPRRPPGWQQTKQQYIIYPLWCPFQWSSPTHIDQWRRSRAFIKATKHRHRVSTCSDSINRTRQHRLFRTFHTEKGLELTCWPQIIIGVWHIKLMRST